MNLYKYYFEIVYAVISRIPNIKAQALTVKLSLKAGAVLVPLIEVAKPKSKKELIVLVGVMLLFGALPGPNVLGNATIFLWRGVKELWEVMHK